MVNYHKASLEKEKSHRQKNTFQQTNVLLLNLIERVMSNLTGVELVQCS